MRPDQLAGARSQALNARLGPEDSWEPERSLGQQFCAWKGGPCGWQGAAMVVQPFPAPRRICVSETPTLSET